MAKIRFLGRAQAVSQVDTITIGGTWSAGEKARITINGKWVEYAAVTADTAALVAAGLQAAAVASTNAEFREITWTVAGAVITATSTAGVPVTLAVSETAASGTITLSNVTAATGPWNWNNADNWSGGAVPAASDEVYLDLAGAAIRYGFPTGLALAKLVQSDGQIGLPAINTAGYTEYRPTHLTVSAAIVQIDGGQLCRVNTESAAAKVIGQARGTDIDVIVNHASAEINALAGTVKAWSSGVSSGQALAARCNAGATLELGYGGTVATVMSAGTTLARCTCTAVTCEGGQLTLEGSATTVNVRDGVLSLETDQTITTLNHQGGTVECRNDIRAKTVTTYNLSAGTLNDPYRVLTIGTLTRACDTLTAVL